MRLPSLKLNLISLITVLSAVVLTFSVTPSNAQLGFGAANPDKLVPKKYSKLRCEVLFTNFSRFIENRQRILMTPLKDPALDLKFKNWFENLNSHLKISDFYRADFDQISEAVGRLSESKQKELALEVAKIYPEVTSEKYKAVKIKELKRTLDVILTRISNPYELFEKRKLKQSAWATYSEYFKRSRSDVGLPQDYSPTDIWNFLHWLQLQMKSAAKMDRQMNGAELIVYGSYVSGRAILKTSDIDAIANGQKTVSFVETLNNDRYFKSLGVDHIAANSSEKFSERTASQLSPVLFVINEYNIVMKVYPPLSYVEIDSKVSPKKPEIFILN